MQYSTPSENFLKIVEKERSPNNHRRSQILHPRIGKRSQLVVTVPGRTKGSTHNQIYHISRENITNSAHLKHHQQTLSLQRTELHATLQRTSQFLFSYLFLTHPAISRKNHRNL